MADFPVTSEAVKPEGDKTVVAPQSTAPHSVGLHVPIKLTRDNFLLWKTQLLTPPPSPDRSPEANLLLSCQLSSER